MPEAQLISASCTTGWLDWIHGELWLFADGLLLVKTDLWTTVAHGTGPSVTSPLKTREFTEAEVAALSSAHRLNRWIAGSAITSAAFHAGLSVGRIALELQEIRVKLLWLTSDKPETPLRRALERWGVPVMS